MIYFVVSPDSYRDQSLGAQSNSDIVISTEGRNHTRKSAKIGDILCGVSRVISRSSK